MQNPNRSTSVFLLAAFVVLASAMPARAQGTAAPKALVNINTATQAELEALPGIGPATAKKIIAGRPFASVADLSKAGVPAATLTKITPLVTAGASTPATPVTPSTAPAATVTPAKPLTPSIAPAKSATETVAQKPPVPGMVWVNTETKVFHREGDKYYGNTKHGKFMTEADAVKAGYRAAKSPSETKKKYEARADR
jgi:hypothetical protein